MPDIHELLRQSELRTGILTIIHRLVDEPDYSKADAVQDLLEFIEKHNL